MAEQTDFTRGFIAGLEAAAGFADYMGGDRYQRADYSRRDPAGRLQQTIEAQHLRARSLATIYRLRADELRGPAPAATGSSEGGK